MSRLTSCCCLTSEKNLFSESLLLSKIHLWMHDTRSWTCRPGPAKRQGKRQGTRFVGSHTHTRTHTRRGVRARRGVAGAGASQGASSRAGQAEVGDGSRRAQADRALGQLDVYTILPSFNRAQAARGNTIPACRSLAHAIPVCRGMKLPSLNSEETSNRPVGCVHDPVCRRFLSSLLCSLPIPTPLPAGSLAALFELRGDQLPEMRN